MLKRRLFAHGVTALRGTSEGCEACGLSESGKRQPTGIPWPVSSSTHALEKWLQLLVMRLYAVGVNWRLRSASISSRTSLGRWVTLAGVGAGGCQALSATGHQQAPHDPNISWQQVNGCKLSRTVRIAIRFRCAEGASLTPAPLCAWAPRTASAPPRIAARPRRKSTPCRPPPRTCGTPPPAAAGARRWASVRRERNVGTARRILRLDARQTWTSRVTKPC